jgi:predicted Zn-dependent protease
MLAWSPQKLSDDPCFFQQQKRGGQRAVEKAGRWKARKTKSRFSSLPTALGNRAQPARFHFSHSPAALPPIEEAVPILEEVLKQEPHTMSAYLQLGRVYVALKEYQKAIAPLQHMVEATPDNSLAHYELGCALVKTGHWNEAVPQFEAAVSQMNSSAMMHFYLALVYRRTHPGERWVETWHRGR